MSQAPKPQLPGNTEDPNCGTHPEPSQLFSDDDQVIVSSKCFQFPEHKQHGAYGIQEAAEYYRKLLQETLVTLREKRDAATSLLAEERERMGGVQEEEQRFKEMIEAEYKMRFQLLTEEEELAAYKVDLNLNGPNPDQLMKCGTELMHKSQEMLQNAKCYLKRNESILLQSLEPAQITDLSSCLIIETSRVLLRLQRHITLDPDTAHPSLVLSEDLRSVGFGETPKTGPGTTRRLDFGASVLCAESFTTGRHYWEVAVGQATQWQVGICDCTERKGSIPGASGDKVLLMGSMMGTDCTLWVFPPLRKVCLRNQMYKVGVFLDCECGQVSFYNVTEQSLIYSFSDLTFRGVVKPIFSLCIPNGDMSSDSLTVCLSQTHP
uniref:Tripartite motif family-like 2 n=1 Tax=Mus spicilegus TaxID=10103 RepID=A0A8C6ID87_MUSSI